MSFLFSMIFLKMRKILIIHPSYLQIFFFLLYICLLLTYILKDRSYLSIDIWLWHKRRYCYDSSHKYPYPCLWRWQTNRYTSIYRYLFQPPHLNDHTNQSLSMSRVDRWDDLLYIIEDEFFFLYVVQKKKKPIFTHKIKIETLLLMIESNDNILYNQNVDEFDCYLLVHKFFVYM
jgi:hypothetical protein